MSKSKKKAPAKKVTALAVRKHDSTAPASNQALAMIERFATNPDFDVEKMKALMEMREREMRRVSEQAFNAAMSAAQKAMRPVARDADNSQTRSRYATYTALDNALRPIYAENDFGLSFNTADVEKPETVRVLCDVAHAGGFSKTYHIDMPADGKGAKGGDVMTKTHATGSAVSYGMRYLLKMIFNVAIGEFDDDGNRAGGQAGFDRRMGKKPPPPAAAPIDADATDVSSQLEISAVLTKAMWERLGRIAEKAGRPTAEVNRWLREFCGVTDLKKIDQRYYKDIVRHLEAKAALPFEGDGQ